MELKRQSDLTLKATCSLGDIPSSVSIKALKRVLAVSQEAWLTDFDALANHTGETSPTPALYFIGGMFDPDNVKTSFGINELVTQGWIEAADVGQQRATVQLAQFIPYTDELDPLHEQQTGRTYYASCFRELLCQHQRLLWSVVSGRFKEQQSTIPELIVGDDIPLDLAQKLVEEGIAICYEKTDTAPYFGAVSTVVAEDSCITLTVQYHDQRDALVQLYKKG